jgi:hypothetical protein
LSYYLKGFEMRKMAPEYVDSYSQPTEARGSLKAYKMIQVTDIFGNIRMRKVSLGGVYSIDFENAQKMISTARAADTDPGSICGNLVIGL